MSYVIYSNQYYYGKDNYLNTKHYGVMWKARNVFSNEKVEDFKLNRRMVKAVYYENIIIYIN